MVFNLKMAILNLYRDCCFTLFKALAMIASAKKQVDNAQYDGETGTHRDESGASVTELIRDRNTGTF
jgi:hypothetical protein